MKIRAKIDDKLFEFSGSNSQKVLTKLCESVSNSISHQIVAVKEDRAHDPHAKPEEGDIITIGSGTLSSSDPHMQDKPAGHEGGVVHAADEHNVYYYVRDRNGKPAGSPKSFPLNKLKAQAMTTTDKRKDAISWYGRK